MVINFYINLEWIESPWKASCAIVAIWFSPKSNTRRGFLKLKVPVGIDRIWFMRRLTFSSSRNCDNFSGTLVNELFKKLKARTASISGFERSESIIKLAIASSKFLESQLMIKSWSVWFVNAIPPQLHGKISASGGHMKASIMFNEQASIRMTC